MAAGVEIELKFLFAERDSAKIKSLISAARGARQPVHQSLRAVYFDTPNRDLWKHGFILRVRASGERYIQTVKQGAASSIHRGEWEEEISQSEPDLALIKNTPLARLAAKPGIRGALRPAFEVNVERTSYWIEAGGGVIEASLDRGAIEANGQKLGVRELELELKSGGRRALFDLAHAFVCRAPLHPYSISKAERGHLLARGGFGNAVKSSKPRLGQGMTCGEGFQQICRTCLCDLHLNRLGLESLDSAEAIHQTRVAIRRLRAAMALFRPMVFDIAYRKIYGELKWLARVLGAARDLDILLANMPGGTAWAGTDSQANDLVRRCEAERRLARKTALAALNSERGRILLLDLAVWIEDGRWQRPPSSIAGEPLQGFAGHRLRKRHMKLVRQGAGLAHLAPGPRHKVRIKAKELRYMTEFLVDVPGAANDRKRLKSLINFCEKLQAALGAIRDGEAILEFISKVMDGGICGEDKTAKDGTAAAILVSGPAPPQNGRGAETEKELKKAVRAYARLAALKAF